MQPFESITSSQSDIGLGTPINSVDLTVQSVVSHFAQSTRRVELLNFLCSLDRADTWALDHQETESANANEIQKFIGHLSRFIEQNINVLHCVQLEFAEILSHLTTTRCLYLIRYASQHNPHYLETLGVFLENQELDSPDMAAIKQRLTAFSRARLLGEIFSGSRLEQINKIMGSY